MNLRPMCPFLDDPCEECHVANLTSGAVERAILYCGGEYGRCDIYRRLAQTKQEQEEKDTGMKTRGEGEEVSDGNAVNVQENSRKGG